MQRTLYLFGILTLILVAVLVAGRLAMRISDIKADSSLTKAHKNEKIDGRRKCRI